jgi:hypothetical protein
MKLCPSARLLDEVLEHALRHRTAANVPQTHKRHSVHRELILLKKSGLTTEDTEKSFFVSVFRVFCG